MPNHQIFRIPTQKSLPCIQPNPFALEELKKNKGTVINIGSKVAETGQGGTSGYAAAKGAMNALTREWALDLADRGIRVNSVIPAEVMTPMYQRWLDSLKTSKKLFNLSNRISLSKIE